MPHIEARDGTPLFYKDWGSGPPVVLIHGWPLNADSWEYQAPALAEAGFRVVAYDRRGFGRSEQPWAGYDYDTFADDLAAILDGLDLRGATLVGFSMGGGEVARYLARHGAGRVAKACLVAAVPPFLLKTEDNPEGADASVFEGMIEKLKEDRPGFLAGFAKGFYGVGPLTFSVSDGILDWTGFMAMHASPHATIQCVRAFGFTDFRPDMAAVKVPTLVIHGDADAIVPIKVSGGKAASMIAGARLETYAGGSHGIFYTERERLARDLIAFARAG